MVSTKRYKPKKKVKTIQRILNMKKHLNLVMNILSHNQKYQA